MNAHEKLLVEALRSGKYVQTKGQLRSVSSLASKPPLTFCCLGVACEISGLGGWEGPTENYRVEEKGEAAEMSGTHLPRAVREWLGWHSPYGALDRFLGNGKDLAGLNDSGMPFEQIADLIEAGLVAETGDPIDEEDDRA